MRNKAILIILLLVILTTIIIAVQNAERKIVQLENRVTALESNIAELHENSQEYNSKVDNMAMSYMSLDEVLNRMFGASQAEYMRRVMK